MGIQIWKKSNELKSMEKKYEKKKSNEPKSMKKENEKKKVFIRIFVCVNVYQITLKLM